MKIKDFIKQTIEIVIAEQQVHDITPIHFDLAIFPNGDEVFVGDDMSCENLSRIKFTIAVTPSPMEMKEPHAE